MTAQLTHRWLLITLCTYNERENLPLLIPEILAQVPQAHILVIDDNSPDGTGRLADQLAANDVRVRVLHRSGKLGLGTATVAGFRYALEQNYEFVLNMDADFSHHPRYLPAILSLMDECDVAIGSRYIPGGNTVGWSLKRQIMSRCINLYARWLLWLSTRDNSGSYRCYRNSKLGEIDLDRVRARGYAFQEEILYRCRRVGCRFAETPIVFEDRRLGTSKINFKETLAALWVLARLSLDNLCGAEVRRPAATSQKH